MALVDLIDISKTFSTQKILDKVSLFIQKGERIAIIGKNGGGKSTLMNIIQGVLEQDEGRRIVQQNIQIEMLLQNPVFDPDLTVKEAILSELKSLFEAKKEYESLNAKLATQYDNKELLKRQSELSIFLETHNVWNLEESIEQLLDTFLLKEYENRNIHSLSGGEQRRVALAGLVLKKPDILLLDEPTNHLDVYMVAFLEEMLLKGGFTLVFVSHDRYFIETLATRCIEIEDGVIRSFDGGYESYLESKETLLLSMQKSQDTLLKLLKSEEEWLRRGVKARLKRNEGRKERVFELREQAKKNPGVLKKMKLELEREKHNFIQEQSINRQKELFNIEKISKRLGSKELIKNFSLRILQKDKIAIVGKNGVGKSTLLHILLGNISPDEGIIKKGEFEIGYFDQQRELLDNSKTILETFCPNGGDHVHVKDQFIHVYGYLKRFLFPKESLNKRIELLSGGEKNRIALALLFTKSIDCLILDEPTNDLDIATINILEEALLNFHGAVIFVSHDRYFVDKIAKKLLIFSGNGKIEESYQTYSDYLAIEKEISDLEAYENSLQKKDIDEKNTTNFRQKEVKKLSFKEQREYDSLPMAIEEKEKEISMLENCLCDPKCYEKKGISKVASDLEVAQKELEEMYSRYIVLEDKLQSLILK